MLVDLRHYRPDAVNRLAQAFDFAADLASFEAAEDMLDAAEKAAEKWATFVPPQGEGMYPLIRAQTERELAVQNVTLLHGAREQARQALLSYPHDIALYAVERFT